MKYFRMSYEEVVFNRSYINIMLLNRSIPSWGKNKSEELSNDKENKNKVNPVKKSVSANDFFMDMMQ